MNSRLKRFAVYVLMLLAVSLFALPAFANSARPTSYSIRVYNPPADFSLTLYEDGKPLAAHVKKTGLFIEYEYMEGGGGHYVLRYSMNGKHFEYDVPDGMYYGSTYNLNTKDNALDEGAPAAYQALYVVLNVVMTLVVEGVVFYLFGFRKKESWKTFFGINLTTQILLNMILLGQAHDMTGQGMLVMLEFVILLLEMLLFSNAVTEHDKARRLGYAATANIASFIAGIACFFILPI